MFDTIGGFEQAVLICVLISGVALLAVIARFVVLLIRHKQGPRHLPEPEKTQDVDLLHYPQKQVVKPYVPKAFSKVGLVLFFFVTSVTILLGRGGELSLIPSIIVSVCFGVAAEVAGSMLKYAIELQIRDDIIFVPQSIGLIGQVVQDIPAAERGLGAIRVLMNGVVTQMQSMSVDEVVLAKGTDVKILYAYTDRIVVVERIVKNRPL